MNPSNPPSAASTGLVPRSYFLQRLWLALGLSLVVNGGLTQETPDFAPRPVPNQRTPKQLKEQADAVQRAEKAVAESNAKAEALARDKEKALQAAQTQSAKEKAEIARLEKALNSKPKPAQPTAPVTTTAAPNTATPTPSPSAPTPGTPQEAYPGGPVLIALKGDSFQMGSAKSDHDNERPVHRVKVERFAMGQTELSFAQWDACVNDTNNPLRCTYKPADAWGRGDQPVIGVSYDDITTQYLPWLNTKTKATAPYQYRLPTEAEWEYAARAGGTGDFSLGPNNSDKIDGTKSNYDTRYSFANSPVDGTFSRTRAVVSFDANAFGLFNMHGNVSEWTADCYNSDEYQRRKSAGGEWPATKTSEEATGCKRVVRGGGWSNPPHVLRVSHRGYFSPDWRRFRENQTFFDGGNGFRLARTLLP